MTLRRIVALVSLVLAIALSSAHASDKETAGWRITTKGFGPVRVGMTVDEASAALGVRLVLDEPLEDDENACRYAKPERGFEGLAFMFVDLRVVRVDVDDRAFATLSGAKIGSTEREVKAIYPGRIRVSPHEYTNGHYLTYTPKDATDKDYRIVFETDGTRVTSIRAGRLPEVEYVEGCS
jgi:hypothetical protein